MSKDFKKLRSVLATDCGSTTTKAILIEYDEEKDEYRLTTRGEAPTTVEAPFEDVTRGVLNAVSEVQELRGRTLMKDGQILTPEVDGVGVDAYISTSSAGGGLQVVVGGVVKAMSAESAERAALSAGAIVMDTLASNDKRLPHEKIDRIRQLRPDMILLSGGIDGGTKKHVMALAELIKAARPRARLGNTFNLPIIYAGNKAIRRQVDGLLGEVCDLKIVNNVRPILEKEDLGPAREMIHDLFMEHVMAQAPGYSKLMDWADAPIMPTPGAVGFLIEDVAKTRGISVVGVDIGGATTDVFSVFGASFNRTVSANLGMSYSVSNVLAEAGMANVLRWVPFNIDEGELRNRIGNKMIRPTTIPQTLEELQIEQAICREALRLAFVQHKSFAVGLKGVQKTRTIADAFRTGDEDTLVDLMGLNLIIGSGGVLSHAPRRVQSFRMMVDAFLPEGVTELAVDSIFMMPHLGVLASVNRRAALEVFEKDCLVRLGSCVAPVGPLPKGNKVAMEFELRLPGGEVLKETMAGGEMKLVACPFGEDAQLKATPHRKLDLGAGKGVAIETTVKGGEVGILFDTRGRRPFKLPTTPGERVETLGRWTRNLGEYPEL